MTDACSMVAVMMKDKHLLTGNHILQVRMQLKLLRFNKKRRIISNPQSRSQIYESTTKLHAHILQWLLAIQTANTGVCQGQQNTELVSLAGGGWGLAHKFLRVPASQISNKDTGAGLGKCLTPQTAQVRSLNFNFRTAHIFFKILKKDL